VTRFDDLDPWLCVSPGVFKNMRTGATTTVIGGGGGGFHTKLGWWGTHISGASTAATNARIAAAVGQSQQIARSYDGTPETGRVLGTDSLMGSMLGSGLGTIEQVISYSHTVGGAIATGSLASVATQLRASLAAISAIGLSPSSKVRACLSHENDHKINTSAYTAAQWYACVAEFDGYIAALGDPNIEQAMIMVRTDTASHLSTYWPNVSGHMHSMWFDPYQGYLSGGGADTPAATWLPMIANIVAVTGFDYPDIGVAETGVLPSATLTQEGGYLTGMASALSQLAGICYFDGAGSLGDTSISGNPTLAHDYGSLWALA
jgi:hypothetical protein